MSSEAGNKRKFVDGEPQVRAGDTYTIAALGAAIFDFDGALGWEEKF